MVQARLPSARGLEKSDRSISDILKITKNITNEKIKSQLIRLTLYSSPMNYERYKRHVPTIYLKVYITKNISRYVSIYTYKKKNRTFLVLLKIVIEFDTNELFPCNFILKSIQPMRQHIYNLGIIHIMLIFTSVQPYTSTLIQIILYSVIWI